MRRLRRPPRRGWRLERLHRASGESLRRQQGRRAAARPQRRRLVADEARTLAAAVLRHRRHPVSGTSRLPPPSPARQLQGFRQISYAERSDTFYVLGGVVTQWSGVRVKDQEVMSSTIGRDAAA